MGKKVKKNQGNPNRWKVQFLSAFLTNPFVFNFFQGKIYRGKMKKLCVPGLNCYSCPGAAGSCPIGAFQAVAGASKFSFSYYIVGILILIGTVLGRVVCGFLCPFGWFQELLHKIPSKKLRTRRLHYLTYFKYILLLVFVCILPITAVNAVGMGDPFFCKYICPAGILEGGIPLSIANDGIRASLGWLFTWKSVILVGVILASVFFYRPFCKWMCPLGAFYALFNKISVYQLHVDKDACSSCGVCSRVCKMDVEVFRTPNHTECIRCGDCIHACPQQAITKSFTLKKEKVS